MIKLILATSVIALATGDLTGYTTPFGSLGITGLLAWYIIYDVKYTRPANEDRLERMAKSHEDKSLAMSTQFTDSLREERDMRKEILDTFKCNAE